MRPSLLAALEIVGCVESIPRGAHGAAVLFPAQARGSAVTVVCGFQLARHLLEAAAFEARPAFPSGAVRGMVVLVRGTGLIVGLARIVLAPVRLLGRGIEHLGDPHRMRARPPPLRAGPVRLPVRASSFGWNTCHRFLLGGWKPSTARRK